MGAKPPHPRKSVMSIFLKDFCGAGNQLFRAVGLVFVELGLINTAAELAVRCDAEIVILRRAASSPRGR